MIGKKAGLDIVINDDVNDIDIDSDIDINSDIEGNEADDEKSIGDSEDIRSINVMIYDDVESEIEFGFEEEETNKLNNNKLNDKNEINYFNDYILAPIHVIYDYCKILYNYINIF